MTDQHPITPPPELILEWCRGWNCTAELAALKGIATQAARWGADQELEACCSEVSWNGNKALAAELRTRRRPKPPSLKEQALEALSSKHVAVPPVLAATIRRALEALPDD